MWSAVLSWRRCRASTRSPTSALPRFIATSARPRISANLSGASPRMAINAGAPHSGEISDPQTDLRWMRAAFALARRGLGNVWPNPAVGCVLVRNGRVVGRGWTQPGGRPHAETEALRRAGALARGATAYVSLEPCSHWGQTPPCADALADAGVRRVVVAIED